MDVRKIAITVALAAAPVLGLAQERPGRAHQEPMHPGKMAGMGAMNMSMMDSMMGPMMQAMAGAPDHLLGMKEALHLTSAQQAQLQALADAAKGPHDAAASQAAAHLRAMVTAMHAAAADTAAVKTHFQAAMQSMNQAHWAMTRGAAQAWPILTEAQRRQVMAMGDSMSADCRRMHAMGGMPAMRGERRD